MSVELSIILPTDTYETIRVVLEHVRQQTIAERLETIIVAPTDAEIPEETTLVRQRIVRVRSTSPLSVARAEGVCAATAPFIFMGETHSYLHREAAEKLLAAAHAGDWSAVVPAFENANPRSKISWASFLADYGKWTSVAPAGKIDNAPLFNALFRRVDLPRTRAALERVFSHGDEILLVLRARSARFYFEPAARMSHLNLNNAHSIREQFAAGVLTGCQRAQRWKWPKRLLYAVASPLIPVVLFRRGFSPACRNIRLRPISWLILPTIFLLNIAKAAGEFLGYVGLTSARAAATMDQYEIHKRAYVR